MWSNNKREKREVLLQKLKGVHCCISLWIQQLYFFVGWIKLKFYEHLLDIQCFTSKCQFLDWSCFALFYCQTFFVVGFVVFLNIWYKVINKWVLVGDILLVALSLFRDCLKLFGNLWNPLWLRTKVKSSVSWIYKRFLAVSSFITGLCLWMYLLILDVWHGTNLHSSNLSWVCY